MLYLIGGAPRAGKSQLLQKFVEQRPMPGFSCDFLYHLEQITSLSDFKGSDILEKGEAFYPTLQQLLINVARRSEECVIEGEVILPRHVAELSKQYEIKACFMGLSSTSLQTILDNGGYFNWVQYKLDHGRSQEVTDLVEKTVQKSKIIEAECEKYGMPYVDMSPNYEAGVTKVITTLLS